MDCNCCHPKVKTFVICLPSDGAHMSNKEWYPSLLTCLHLSLDCGIPVCLTWEGFQQHFCQTYYVSDPEHPVLCWRMRVVWSRHISQVRNGQVNDWVKDEQDILHDLKVQGAFRHSHQPPPLCWVHNLSLHRVTRRGGKYLQIMLHKLSRESRTNSRRAREPRCPRSLRAEPESATARHGMALMSQISS